MDAAPGDDGSENPWEKKEKERKDRIGKQKKRCSACNDLGRRRSRRNRSCRVRDPHLSRFHPSAAAGAASPSRRPRHHALRAR